MQDRAPFSDNPAYREAYVAFLREDFDVSIHLLDRLEKESPQKKGEYSNDLAVCYYLAGDRKRSQAALTVAADILGKRSAPHINLSYIFGEDLFAEPEDHLGGHDYSLPPGRIDLSGILVSIVILEYNNPQLTLNCLRSIRSTLRAIPYEVILIDNSDNSPSFDFAHASGLQTLTCRKNRTNLGFAAGCNQGAALARGDYIYFVNNDTLFQDGCLEELARVLVHDKKAGIVGSKLLYEDGLVQHGGIIFDLLTHDPKHRGLFHPSDDPFLNIPLKLQAVTAASMMIRRELFETVGGFSEDYQNGFEDVDLCLKSLRAGYDIIYNPRSVLYHLESQSPGRFLREKENIALFHKRCSPYLVQDESEIISRKDLFLRCFTENPRKRWRQGQLFSLVDFLDRKHPQMLSSIPLFVLEKMKHLRFQKACTHLFDTFAEKGQQEEARILYRYFRRRHIYRLKYINYLRSKLKDG